jgi:hypothetical protein
VETFVLFWLVFVLPTLSFPFHAVRWCFVGLFLFCPRFPFRFMRCGGQSIVGRDRDRDLVKRGKRGYTVVCCPRRKHVLRTVRQFDSMNHPVFRLPEFEVDVAKANEALSCLVHTMVVVRSIENDLQPQFVDCSTFPLTYASSDSNELSMTIDTELSRFLSSLRRISPGERQGVLRVCFSTKYRTSSGGNSAKQFIFEEWQINVVVSDATPPASTDVVYAETRQRQDRNTMGAVRDRVIYIIKEAAASETKLPECFGTAGSASSGGGASGGGSGGGKSKKTGSFPYDLTLLYDGKVQKKKTSSGFLSSAKSFASSWFS